jgi:hypothetical protein
MARAGKVGIDYFSHDTDIMSDNKIRFIKAKHGLLGYAVFLRLLENIYSENGYFVKIDEKFNILFADDNKIDLNVYILILNDCIEEGLFNKELYLKHKILTSKRIQINYIAATERRKSIEVVKEYLLINIIEYKNSNNKCSVNILSLNDNILELNTCKSTQKEKEKEKEKENISIYVQHHHLKLTETERGELIEKHGKKDVEDMIKKIKSLSAAYLSKYDNMFLIIDAWIEKEKEKNCAAKQAPLSNVDLILSKYDK